MTIDAFITSFYKTAVYFVNYIILPSRCCLCTNIYDPNRILFLCVKSCWFELHL